MTVSVIIPTYNEAKYIGNCLSSLERQTFKAKEIIVIDDGSTDKTVEALSEFRILRQAHQGAGAARNLGAKHAIGDILVFVDADMEFSPQFLDELTLPIRQGKSKGTFSKQEFVKNWDNPWARSWSYCLGLKDNHLIPGDYPDTAPVFRAILKSEFDRVGGFDEDRGYDDDWSLSEKLGYQAIATNAVYYHHNPDSYLEIFRQARWRASQKYKLSLIRNLAFPPYNLAKLFFTCGTVIGLIFPRNRK